jgi:NAD(P)-dependent dehydrogenase (short-subunit alcohol dehydrogenase family)
LRRNPARGQHWKGGNDETLDTTPEWHVAEHLFDNVNQRKLQDHLLASHEMKPQPKPGWSRTGIPEDLRDPAHFSVAEHTIDTNLLGTIRVIDAFTPHLIGRGAGTIITVSSGIGFLPFPVMPTYAASKAAVHAYSEALRAQLDGTGIEVSELVPPPRLSPPGRMRNSATPTRST